MAALQKTEPPAREPFFSGQGGGAPAQAANGVPAPPPSNIPEPPPPPGSAAMDQDDGEFEDDIRCYVLYDFQGEMTSRTDGTIQYE